MLKDAENRSQKIVTRENGKDIAFFIFSKENKKITNESRTENTENQVNHLKT